MDKKPVGRPALYDDPEEMASKAIEFFEGIKQHNEKFPLNLKHPTITGLVLYLGFCDRSAFYAYEKKEKFKHTIKYLRTTIENVYENNLFGANVTGIIFALKNLGWSDKTEQEVTHKHPDILYVRINGKPTDIMTGKEVVNSDNDSD